MDNLPFRDAILRVLSLENEGWVRGGVIGMYVSISYDNSFA